jgi:SAM-dependent methyltransferase
MHPSLEKRLVDAASEPYRHTGRFNYHWARGKLGGDPIFPALLQLSIFPDDAYILDLGCGRGLLAAWLLAAEQLAAQGRLGDDTLSPPAGLNFSGIDLMERAVICGNQALQPLYGNRVQLSSGDICKTELADADVITIFDVLHYLPYAEQDRLLDRIRDTLGKNGLFVTRVGNADGSLRFAFGQLVDFCVSAAHGHRITRMWCRPLDEWINALEARNFVVEAIPMSTGTPFANVMLVARAS